MRGPHETAGTRDAVPSANQRPLLHLPHRPPNLERVRTVRQRLRVGPFHRPLEIWLLGGPMVANPEILAPYAEASRGFSSAELDRLERRLDRIATALDSA